jgi:hypothetical protein
MIETSKRRLYSRPTEFERIRLRLIYDAFRNGMRADSCGVQPAQWLRLGLAVLEKGERLSVEKLRKIDKAGGTDHPDPWFV